MRSGLTQAQLAGRLDISQASVARLEAPASNPTIATITRVLAATGHSLEMHAQAVPGNVEETLIAQRLALSPAERLRSFAAAHRQLAALRGVAKRQRNAAARADGA